jgi:hypothetical protein
MLVPANERENLTDEEIMAIVGNLSWGQGLSHPDPPISPSHPICYLPTANPPVNESGEPLIPLDELASIELDYLQRILQIYKDADIDFPYFAVGGEFNITGMNRVMP